MHIILHITIYYTYTLIIDLEHLLSQLSKETGPLFTLAPGPAALLHPDVGGAAGSPRGLGLDRCSGAQAESCAGFPTVGFSDLRIYIGD